MAHYWPLRLLFGCCLIWTRVSVVTSEEGKSTYWLSFAQRLRPGAPLAVKVHVPRATRPFNLRLELMDREGRYLQEGQSYALNATDALQTVQFHISKTLPKLYFTYMYAQAWGGVQFEGFEQVFYHKKRLSIFIQTDQPIYRPGQTVKFLALATLPDTTVLRLPMDVDILDPLLNRMKQWTGQITGGVLQGEMNTSVSARRGFWTINVTVDGVFQTKRFRLEGYKNVWTPPVLPKPQVELILRNYALITDTSVKVKVIARYQSRTPIQSNVTFSATLHNRRKPHKLDFRKHLELDQNGEAEAVFTIDELRDLTYDSLKVNIEKELIKLQGRQFRFLVEVKDKLNGRVTRVYQMVRFEVHPRKLVFLPLTPNRFKPGLPFTAYVQALQPDGKPILNPEDVTLNATATYSRVQGTTTRPGTRPKFVQEVLNISAQLDFNGIGVLTTPTLSPNARSDLVIRVTDGHIIFGKRLLYYIAREDASLQLVLKTLEIQVGKAVEVQMRSTKPFCNFTYQIFSKDQLVVSKRELRALTNTTSFSFLLTSAMAPVAHLVVFSEFENGQMLVERLDINVQKYSDHQVTLEFPTWKVKPGDTTKLIVKAEPGSTVFVLGLDDRIRRTDNDIDAKDILAELKNHDEAKFVVNAFFSASTVMKYMGVGVITDAVISTKYKVQPRHYTIGRSYQTNQVYDNKKFQKSPEVQGKILWKRLSFDNQDEKYLPDTWLWDKAVIGKNGNAVIEVTVPNTLTNLTVTAVAVHPTLGLTVSASPVSLLITQPLYVTMELPRSVVLGEAFCFKTYAYNLGDKSDTVKVGFKKEMAAFAVLGVRKKKNSGNTTEVYEISKPRTWRRTMLPYTMMTRTWCLKPHTIGDMTVHMQAKGRRESGDVVRTVNVKATGDEKSRNYPVLLETGPIGQVTHDVNIHSLPKNVVKGSLQLSVTAGDVLAVVADNLEDLLKMSYSNGEGNMVHVAASTYVISHMTNTDRLSPALLSRAKSLIETGYQQQMKYQRYDSSFSAFGNRDKSGNMWLTAFVTKIFVQAEALGSDVFAIEPDVIRRTVGWITQNQNPDGSFRNVGPAIHQSMQGGEADYLRLTAYVTVTLIKVNRTFSEKLTPTAKSRVRTSLAKALGFLEAQPCRADERDPYTASIMAYALCLAQSPKAYAAVQRMRRMADFSKNTAYWSGPEQSKSLDIETTSYALLALTYKRLTRDVFPVFRWLVKQMGPKGGFVSIQDTVVAVEALASAADLIHCADSSSVDVTVTWRFAGSKRKSSTLMLNKDSMIAPQTLHIPLKATGDEKSRNYPVLLETGPIGQVTRDVNVHSLPKNVVKGSLQLSVTAGDVLAVVADNLEDLLKMSYSNGEGNMVHVAASTYVISHMTNTDRLSPALLSRAKSLIETGYQQQMKYQRYDSSFSAFGNRDKSGNMWLTAFVTKIFVQAEALGSDVFAIEPDVIRRTVGWITQNQNPDGSFRNVGPAIHQSMQGGEADHLRLTAYVTVTLIKVNRTFSEKLTPTAKSRVRTSLAKALGFLEAQPCHVDERDPYTASIMAYALCLAQSPKAYAAVQRMRRMADFSKNTAYWSGPEQSKSLDIETTSYALLALTYKRLTRDVFPVFRWLVKQMGPKGGFVSIQDTVVAVEALASAADLIHCADSSSVDVTVTWRFAGSKRKSSTLMLNKDSMIAPQTLHIPLKNGKYPVKITIRAKSSESGVKSVLALAQVRADYHVQSSTTQQGQEFSVQAKVKRRVGVITFALETCVSRRVGNSSQPESIVVTEITVPSGFEVHSRHPFESHFGNAFGVNFAEGKVELYHYASQLNSTGDCSFLWMKMTRGTVVYSRPAAIRVYSINNPEKENTIHYNIKQFPLCDLAPTYIHCLK